MNKPKQKCGTKPKRRFKCRNGNYGWMGLFERLIFKITSGRFIFCITVAAVYAFLATTGQLEESRVNEITMVVLYAYYNRPKVEILKNDEDPEEDD